MLSPRSHPLVSAGRNLGLPEFYPEFLRLYKGFRWYLGQRLFIVSYLTHKYARLER